MWTGARCYGERNSLEKFIIRTNQGQDFVEAVGSLLRNLNRLENKELQKQGLSLNVKKIFITLRQKYGIPEEKKSYIIYGGTIRTRVSNTDWFWFLIILIILIILIFSGKLNFLFDFLEKYLK